MQTPKTFDEITSIVSHIRYHHMNQDWTFHVGLMGSKLGVDIFYLQLRYIEPDVETGDTADQHGRKWFISPYMTVSEIVQTAFKAVLTSMEHIAREHFEYKGVRVLGPHFDVEEIVKSQIKHDVRK